MNVAETSAPRAAWSVAIYPRFRGRALLIRHHRLGLWLPPGGECEPGESPLEAARRELLEETGLVATFPIVSEIEGTPPGLIGYEEHQAGAKGLHRNFVFVADVDREEVRPNDEFSEWRWVSERGALEGPANVWQLLKIALDAAPQHLEALARRWLSAFNAQDLDGLLALYAADAVHLSPKLRVAQPETQGRIVGQAALRRWWADAFARLPGLRYEEVSLTADGQRVWMEYRRLLPGEPTLLVAEVLEVQGGLIRSSRVFHG